MIGEIFVMWKKKGLLKSTSRRRVYSWSKKVLMQDEFEEVFQSETDLNKKINLEDSHELAYEN